MNSKYKSTIYVCYLSYITQAIVNNFTPILFVIFQRDFNITFEMIGRLILINFVTQICVDYISIKVIDKVGYRYATMFAHFCCTLGLVLLGILPSVMENHYLGLIISTVIFATGGGMIEVAVSPIIDAIPSDEKASAMSLLHSFYCWGQMLVVLVSTILIKIAGDNSWRFISYMWAIIPLICLISFIKVPMAPMVSSEERINIKEMFKSRFFVLALIMMTCSGSAEITISQWSSLFAEKGLGIPKFVGDILGPCLFAFLMAMGRVLHGIKGQNINLKKALTLCAGLCVVCYLVTALSKNPIVSLLGCALTGLCASLMWPGVISLTSKKYPLGGASMFGFLALFGDVGCSFGPWVSGVVSDTVIKYGHAVNPEQFGLKMGILAATIFPLALFIILLFKNVEKKEIV